MTDETKIVAESDLRQQRLFEELATSPIIEISGVVAPKGVGGAKSQGEELWTLLFSFDGWRDAAAEFQPGTLHIRREVTHEELEKLQDLIKSYAVVRIQARVVIVNAASGNGQALLENFIDVDESDAELNAHAEYLQQPIIFEDQVFGKFTFERGISWFTGEALWNQKLISLNLSARDPEEVEESLKTARSLWQNQEAWQQQINNYAARRLLPLKNDSWLDEDEDEITAEQFKERMKLETITADPDGSFDFWHNDGDLFWGHSIQVSGNLTEGLTNADIPG